MGSFKLKKRMTISSSAIDIKAIIASYPSIAVRSQALLYCKQGTAEKIDDWAKI